MLSPKHFMDCMMHWKGSSQRCSTASSIYKSGYKGQCEAQVEIVGVVALGMHSYWELGFVFFGSVVVVSDAFWKRSFCLADIKSKGGYAINLVNYVGQEAINVFFNSVGGYLQQIVVG